MKTPIVILGIGKSGLAAQALLLKKGISSLDLFTFDEKNKTAQFNQWSDLDQMPIGTFVLSPGLPIAKPELQNLLNKGWTLTSEINIASECLTTEIVIGITGSVGKSTVTSLLGAALTKVDPQAFIGGNLGIPFCEYAIKLLGGESKAKYVVLELSSYQLENCSDLKLDYSAITFLSANHLERYSSADIYYKTKCNIGKMTKHSCVINKSSEDLQKYSSFISGQTISVNRQILLPKQKEKAHLIGDHNLDNISVALKICELLKIEQVAKLELFVYKGLAHRLEQVGLINNVLYINDSKATAMDSVLVATQALLTKVTENHFLYLLLGGRDKNLPWQDLAVLKYNQKIKFFFFGECGEIAKNKSQLSGLFFSTLSQTLKEIQIQVQPGDVVLLSPGGTSLDEFNNFEERGSYFKNYVLKN